MARRAGDRPPYATVRVVLDWCELHWPWVEATSADDGRLRGRYARSERAFVEAHASLLHPPSAVLTYLVEEVPDEFAAAYPDERTWGTSPKAIAAARAAEAEFAAAPRRTQDVT